MRALVALLVLLPLVLSARVFNDPFDLHALARQAANEGVPKVPPQFNINSGGPEIGRFVAEAPEWMFGNSVSFIDEDAVIGGAEEKNLPMYKSHRFGVSGATWGYNIPVMEPGIYGCTAHFAELHTEAFMSGKRVFDLQFATAHGDRRNFENIDVFDELDGAEFTVLTKTAENLVITGILAVHLKPVVGDAMLSGLTCERTGDLPPGVEPDFETDPRVPTAPVADTNTGTDNDGTMSEGVTVSGTEININCGGEAIGRFSAEDFSWIRGTTSQWEGPPGVEIGGAEKKNQPAVKSHRYGQDGTDWGYVIPLENPGIYDCSLHFSETDSQSFKLGARVFDIMIMDILYENVDIYRDAGMAHFTAVVKTFTGLTITSDLMIGFKAKVGNAFISAITCEKTGSLMIPEDSPDAVIASPDGDMTEEPSPPAVDPSLAPSPVPPMESPMPTPVVVFPPDETPMTEPSEPIEPTPIASAISTELPEEPTPPAIESPSVTEPQETPSIPTGTGIPDVTLDPPLEEQEGTFIQEYDMRAVVTNGVLTEFIKDTLISVSTDDAAVPSTFAMINYAQETTDSLVRRLIKFVSRQGEDTTNSYVITLQARHDDVDSLDTINKYTNFIKSGEVNDRLKERGVENVEIEHLETRAITTPTVAESNTSNTSVIVGATVGSILAVLVVVALVAFFVVSRKRNSEPSAAAFDAPPPAMTESEMSSVRERSETGASVEYLDDDSTFTAATSRAGDNHVDQVGFVKDVFGRGTADGAHGSS